MSSALRSLAPSFAVAFLLTAVLVAWIRLQPLGMPRALQVALSIGLVTAVAVVISLVRSAAQPNTKD